VATQAREQTENGRQSASAYSEYLEAALEESEAFIIVGYSEDDRHLNDLLKGYKQADDCGGVGVARKLRL
jgi:hypothetical protein